MKKTMLGCWTALMLMLMLSLAPMADAVAQNTSAGAEEIVIGQSSALTGILGELGVANTRGSQAYFDHVNANGGVHGRSIRLITLDDGYDAGRAAANVKRLIEQEQAVALFGIVGIPANLAIMPMIEQAGILNFAPYSGSAVLRSPHRRLLFNVRASYVDEIEKIVEHLGIRGITNIGAVVQDNAFGAEGLGALEQALAKRNLRLSAKAGIRNDSSDVEQAAATLAQAKVQSIVLITVGKPSFDFVRTFNEHNRKQKRQQGTQFFALSVLGSQSAINALGKDGVGLIVAQVSPFPFSGTTALVREYQSVIRKAGMKEFSYPSMEGFLNAKILTEALRRAGRNPKRESVIAALEAMGKVDFDGHIVQFSKTNHQASRYVELTVISRDGRFLR